MQNSNIKDIYGLTALQQGILFHYLKAKTSQIYVEQLSCILHGNVVPVEIQATVVRLFERHDALRTAFVFDDVEAPVQVVFRDRNPEYCFYDLTAFSDRQRITFFEAWKTKDKKRAFDLTRDCLFRVALFKFDEADYHMVWTWHHIILDGWSLATLASEFRMHYKTISTGQSPNQEKPAPFSNFLIWMRDKINPSRTLNYFEEYLEGLTTSARYPFNIVENPDFRKSEKTVIVDENLSHDLNQFCRANQVTLNSVVHATWGLLYATLCNTPDVVFGSVVSGRPADLPNVESIVGLFINTIPVRVTKTEGKTFLDLVREIQTHLVDNNNFHYAQLAEIQARCTPGQDLINHVVAFENYPLENIYDGQDTLRFSDISVEEHINYTFGLVVEAHNALRFRIIFNANSYSNDQISAVANYLILYLEQLVKSPFIDCDQIRFLTTQDKVLLEQWGSGDVDLSSPETINAALFSATRNFADRTAIVNDKGCAQTYQQLDEAAHRIAMVLQSNYGVLRQDVIGILIDRDTAIFPAMLGIWYAACVYLPVDGTLPAERLNYIIADSGCKYLLITRNQEAFDSPYARLLYIEDLLALPLKEPRKETAVSPGDVAYVIYTSGSSGKPKGVQVSHGGVANMSFAQVKSFGVSSDDNVLQFASLTFDASISEILMAWFAGARLTTVPQAMIENTSHFIDYMRSNEVSIVTLPPPYLASFKDEELQFLKTIITAGESPNHKQASGLSQHVKYFNAYGPTECSVCVSLYELRQPLPADKIPIGKPLANSRVYILDDKLGLLPPGVVGEICVSGIGLAHSYVNNADATWKTFIKNPFATPGFERLYRTGDYGKWLEDGNLFFHGRRDQQAKLRGHRIEIEEVEHAIERFPSVVKSAVTILENNVLAAFIRSTGNIDYDELRNFLTSILPGYMVPGQLIFIDEFPITASGKINRTLLKAPERHRSENIDDISAEEQILVEAWKKILFREHVSPSDNFFQLGGDSIKAIQIASYLNRKGWKLEVRDIFQFPVIRSLRSRIHANTKQQHEESVSGSFRLSPIQKFFLDKRLRHAHIFNQAIFLTLPENTNSQLLREIFACMLTHHDMLRATFPQVHTSQEQQVKKNLKFEFEEYDFQSDAGVDEMILLVANDLQSGIDLTSGPLMKVSLFKVKGATKILWVIHHLVVDTFSWRILIEDFQTLFHQGKDINKMHLGGKTASYKRWINQLYDRIQTTQVNEVPFWTFQLNKQALLIQDVKAEQNKVQSQKKISFVLTEEETRKILTTEAPSSAFIEMFAALHVSLARVFKKNSIVYQLEAHGRDTTDLDVSRTVGWFTTVYPLVIDIDPEIDWKQVTKKISVLINSVPNKGLGFSILRFLEENPSIPSDINPSVSFNYLGEVFDSRDQDIVIDINGTGKDNHPDNERMCPLDVFAIVFNGQLEVTLSFGSLLFQSEAIEHVAQSFRTLLIASTDLEVEKAKGRRIFLPLTPTQQGIFAAVQTNRGRHDYYEQFVYNVSYSLDEELLARALSLVGERHPALHASFHLGDDEIQDLPAQVLEKRALVLGYFDITGFSITHQDDIIRKAADSYFLYDIDLAKDSLFKLSLYKRTSEKFTLLLNTHHILLDGWSMAAFTHELFQIYDDLRKDTIVKPQSPLAVDSYFHWLGALDHSRVTEYWTTYLSGFARPSFIPPLHVDHSGQVLSLRKKFLLTKQKTDRLRNAANSMQVTLSSVVHACWAVLLSRYNETTDVLFGTVRSGRPSEVVDCHRMLGVFINTVPLRVRVNKHDSFRKLCQQVQTDFLDTDQMQYYPLSRILSESGLRGNAIDHILTFDNYPINDSIHNQFGLELVSRFEQNEFTLNVDMTIVNKELEVTFVFNSGKFSEKGISILGAHFIEVITQVSVNVDQRIDDINNFSEADRDFYATVNQTARPFESKSVSQIIDEHATKTPDATALVSSAGTLTYRQYSEASTRLAHFLLSRGIERGTNVLVLYPRSLEMAISILGIFKAGCVYVPIEQEIPTTRLRLVQQDTSSTIAITEYRHVEKIRSSCPEITTFICPQTRPATVVGGAIYFIEDIHSSPAHTLVTNKGEDIAYIIFTSGSTGKPKGAMIEHIGMCNHLYAKIHDLSITNETRIAQNANATFDISIWQFLAAPVAGGTTVIYNEEVITDPLMFIAAVKRDAISILEVVPSYLNVMLSLMSETQNEALLNGLKAIVVTGEEVKPKLVEAWFRTMPQVQLVNAYGPTEASDDITHFMMNKFTPMESIPIGRAIQNMSIYVVDESECLCPVGIKGEIWVAGTGVGKGYINDPEKTQHAFTVDVFNTSRPVRLYKTGDIGQYLPDGNIMFFGRKDFQLKIRGHRIEPGEIENQLATINGVKQVVVCDYQRNENQVLLAAYLEMDSQAEWRPLEMKKVLAGRIPPYMIPDAFIKLDQFPLTSNGKIDRKALRVLAVEEIQNEQQVLEVPPSTPEESILLEMWKELLGREKLSTIDDFFSVGGHSLNAIQLAFRIQKAFNKKIDIREIFLNPTVRQLSKVISEKPMQSLLEIRPVSSEKNSYPLSNAQRRLWILNGLSANTHVYNIPFAFKIKGEMDVEILNKCFTTLIERHEILRTIFKMENGQGTQIVVDTDQFPFHVEYQDLRGRSDRHDLAMDRALQQRFHQFNLHRLPLLRVELVRLEDVHYVLLINIHHIISDAWSMALLSAEIFSLYYRCLNGMPANLPELAIQYKDYSIWQLSLLESSSIQMSRSFWLGSLKGKIPVLYLTTDFPRPPQKTYEGNTISTVLSSDQLIKLQKMSADQSASLFIIMNAMVKLLLHRHSEMDDIIIGTTVSGRHHPNLENQIGFYVNAVALPSHINRESTFDDFLKQVKLETLEMFRHQHYPFDKLVDELELERDPGRSPVFDVLLEFQNEPLQFYADEASDKIPFTAEPIEIKSKIAKYDLTFFFFHTGKSLEVMVEYNVALFRESTIQRMIGHLFNLIEQVCLAPSTKIKDIELLAPKEKSVLKQFATAGGRAPLIEHTYIELFNNIVRQSGDRIAIEFGNNQISYWQLEDMSEAIASQLRSLGIGAGEIVGLMSQRSAYTVAALLGIMKSGAAFLPVDVRYPKERKQYILSESGAKALLIESNELLQAIDIYSGPLLSIDNVSKAEVADRSEQVTTILESTAYVIYTSGTTGNPKGVAVGQKSFVNYIEWANRYYFADRSDQTFAFFTSLSFDLTLTSIFTTLLRADKICIYENEDPATTLRSIFEKTSGITAVKMTPSHVRLLEGLNLDGTNVSTVILGGEQLEERQAEYLHRLNAGMAIYNEYGPTEATVGCTIKQVTPEQMVTIGIPITGAEIYILDTTQKQTAVGVNGEIYIGGNVLAKEYLNEPALTASKFIHTEWGRLYKTGDTGKWLDNGEIALSGRNDDQVKIRGFRVELTEIERKLNEFPPVEIAAVAVDETVSAHKEIIAYVKGGAINIDDLNRFLRNSLPEAMIPSRYFRLDDIPITSHGKINRAALVSANYSPIYSTKSERTSPSTPVEKHLIEVWAGVLGHPDIGMNDRLFDLGGNSLKIIEIVSRFSEIYPNALHVADLFNYGTIAELSEVIKSRLSHKPEGNVKEFEEFTM